MLALAPSLTGLQHLNLNTNIIGAEGLAALGCPMSPSLQVSQAYSTSLSLYSNAIGAAVGASALAPLLETLAGLQHLELGQNKFGAEGAAALAPCLHALTKLKFLAVAENGVGAKGTTVLAPTLQALTALQHLCLDQNNIGGEGVTALTLPCKASQGYSTWALATLALVQMIKQS